LKNNTQVGAAEKCVSADDFTRYRTWAKQMKNSVQKILEPVIATTFGKRSHADVVDITTPNKILRKNFTVGTKCID